MKSGRLPSRIPAYSTFDVRLPLAWPYCMPDAIHTANMKELMFNDRAGCILLRSGRSGPTIVNYPCVVPHKCTRRLMLFLSAHRCVPTIFWCIQIQDWKKTSWESRMYFHCISIRWFDMVSTHPARMMLWSNLQLQGRTTCLNLDRMAYVSVYWPFKLHGLNHFYSCEIKGNASYRGRHNFEKDFAETKHSYCTSTV